MGGEEKRKGIPVQQPVFYWDYGLGPRTGSNEKRGQFIIDRCEVLISGNKCFFYGYIINGELYAYDARDWKEIFWKTWFDNNKNKKPAEFDRPGPGHSFIHAPIFHKRVSDVKALGQKPPELKSIKLIPGEIYRFWVDYYLVDEQGLRSVVNSDRRVHFIGNIPWAPIPPHESDKAKSPKEWQVVKIPLAAKGKRPKVILNCRRYAFLPRIMDLVGKLKTYQKSYTKHLATLGTARSLMQSLYQIGSYSINDNTQLSLHLGNYVSGKKVDDWMRSYYRITRYFYDLLTASELFLLEFEETARLSQWANIRARKLYHTLKENKQFLLDLNFREANGHNSDQIRDIIAEAQLVLMRTPPVINSRYLKENEIEYNYDKTDIKRIKGFSKDKAPDVAWKFYESGKTPRVKGYWFAKGWDKKYVDDIFKPFINAAKSGGLKKEIQKTQKQGVIAETVATLSPLFAARENLTVLTAALGTHLSGNARGFTQDVFQLLKDQKLIKDSVTFEQATATLKMNGAAADDFVTPKGMSGILAGSGLTTMFKWMVMSDAWDKAGVSGQTKDFMEASQKTADYFANGMGLADDLLSYLGKAEGASKALGKAGGALGVLADTFDTGMFVYYEFMVEDKNKRIDYSEDYLDKTTAYNCVIAGGKVLNTLGSAFTCSVVGAPIGLVLKAIGLGVSTLTELIMAIDGIGEKEKKLFIDLWKKLKSPGAYANIIDFYNKTMPKQEFSVVNEVEDNMAVLNNKFLGLGDYWVGMKGNRIEAMRQVFQKYSQADLKKKA